MNGFGKIKMTIARSKYINGYRWCARCEVWQKTDAFYHECGNRLRKKSKHFNVANHKRIN